MKVENAAQLAEIAAELKSRPRPPVKLLVSLGTCGIAAGTQPVLKAIRDEITERRLENAIEVSEVGCMVSASPSRSSCSSTATAASG